MRILHRLENAKVSEPSIGVVDTNLDVINQSPPAALVGIRIRVNCICPRLIKMPMSQELPGGDSDPNDPDTMGRTSNGTD